MKAFRILLTAGLIYMAVWLESKIAMTAVLGLAMLHAETITWVVREMIRRDKQSS